MEQTLALIHKEQGPEAVQEIVQSGFVCETKSGIRYLLISGKNDTEQES